jgi:hypothetical protein
VAGGGKPAAVLALVVVWLTLWARRVEVRWRCPTTGRTDHQTNQPTAGWRRKEGRSTRFSGKQTVSLGLDTIPFLTGPTCVASRRRAIACSRGPSFVAPQGPSKRHLVVYNPNSLQSENRKDQQNKHLRQYNYTGCGLRMRCSAD